MMIIIILSLLFCLLYIIELNKLVVYSFIPYMHTIWLPVLLLINKLAHYLQVPYSQSIMYFYPDVLKTDCQPLTSFLDPEERILTPAWEYL